MLDERIFHFFRTKALVEGREVFIGVSESQQMKRKAVVRGFEGVIENENTPLSWMPSLVMLLRAATTTEAFNHEWWGAQTFKPEWARKLDELFGDGWLYYPRLPEELTPKALGKRLGSQMTLQERRLQTAVNDPKFLMEWERADFQKAIRGNEEFADKTRVILPGFDSWEHFASEQFESVRHLRGAVFAQVNAKASVEDFTLFAEGFSQGAKDGCTIDLWDNLSEFNERVEVVEILGDHCLEIDELPNRSEITKYVCRYLSPSRQLFLRCETQWLVFSERMREYYEKIGLKKKGRGRPRKNREEGE